MTDISYKWELGDIGRGLHEIARAIEKSNKKEPIFIFLPSDAKPEDAKKMAEMLREALR